MESDWLISFDVRWKKSVVRLDAAHTIQNAKKPIE